MEIDPTLRFICMLFPSAGKNIRTGALSSYTYSSFISLDNGDSWLHQNIRFIISIILWASILEGYDLITRRLEAIDARGTMCILGIWYLSLTQCKKKTLCTIICIYIIMEFDFGRSRCLFCTFSDHIMFTRANGGVLRSWAYCYFCSCCSESLYY